MSLNKKEIAGALVLRLDITSVCFAKKKLLKSRQGFILITIAWSQDETVDYSKIQSSLLEWHAHFYNIPDTRQKLRVTSQP